MLQPCYLARRLPAQCYIYKYSYYPPYGEYAIYDVASKHQRNPTSHIDSYVQPQESVPLNMNAIVCHLKDGNHSVYRVSSIWVLLLVVTGEIVKQKTCYLQDHEKSLMFKYSKMQRKIPSRLVCGFRGTCLDCTSWGSSHRWVGVFSAFRLFSLYIVKVVTPCSIGFGLLAGLWWDSKIEKKSCSVRFSTIAHRVQQYTFETSQVKGFLQKLELASYLWPCSCSS